MRTNALAWFGVTGLIFAVFSTAGADDQADAKAALEKAGVRVLTTGVLLANEGDLGKELGKSVQLRRTLTLATKDMQAAEQTLARGQQALNQIKTQHIQLSTQLAKVNPNDVATNNRLVGALQALEGKLDLGKQELAKLEEQAKIARTKQADARTAYLEFVIAARKLADTLEADYAKKAADPEIKANLAKLNAATGKQFTLAPTAALTASIRRLKQLEDTIVSEAIPLRSDGQRLWVTVHFNGQHQEELVLNSGASSVCLTAPLAAKFNVKPTEKDPPVKLVLADGRELQGRLITLKSVRVGKFEVEDVECVVLGEDAVAAEPQLGLTFLDSFKYEIDSAAKTLTMVKVSEGSAAVKGAK